MPSLSSHCLRLFLLFCGACFCLRLPCLVTDACACACACAFFLLLLLFRLLFREGKKSTKQSHVTSPARNSLPASGRSLSLSVCVCVSVFSACSFTWRVESLFRSSPTPVRLGVPFSVLFGFLVVLPQSLLLATSTC